MGFMFKMETRNSNSIFSFFKELFTEVVESPNLVVVYFVPGTCRASPTVELWELESNRVFFSYRIIL